LKKVANANGGMVTQKIYKNYRQSIDPTIADDTTISRQIGWNKALSLIGIERSKFQNNQRITEEELLEELLKLWITIGRQPTTTDLKNGLCKYPRERFSARFGSWGKTLNKFMEWINSKDIEMVNSSIHKQDTKRKTSRDVNVGLRFKVMQRDYFRCCICGNTQKESPLQVDHIIPWSKGGETLLENLQTLCRDCNLGKSDSFI